MASFLRRGFQFAHSSDPSFRIVGCGHSASADVQGAPVEVVPLYELRTYTLRVGTMAEAVKLDQEIGFPALQKGSHDKKLIGYFQGDTGTINQIVHLWKFDDDADRRTHWAAVYANKDFVEGFASKFRPLLMTQEVKLLQAAPWGPHP
jgi:NIPSNAP